MLNLWRRHKQDCPHRFKGRRYLKCPCPIWIDWRIGGQRIRKPIGLRDWQKAQQRAREWEAAGFAEAGNVLTIPEACTKFLEDARARNLQESTLYKYQLLFRQLQGFVQEHGLVFVSDFNLDWTRKFRATWKNRNMAARTKFESLRAFFRFAHDSGWIEADPTAKLKSPKVTEPPTMPFTQEQMKAIVGAINKYPKITSANAVRLRALVLLLRYSGLRIRDAVTLERQRITDGKLLLYTSKTGVPVYCPLPPAVIEALNAVPTSPCFFWSGVGKPKTRVGNWQAILRRLFILAGVPDGHAHRFRHTYAVELLLAGVPMDRVSVLLGHASTKVTEKHYAPWVRSRQEQLEEDVRGSWDAIARLKTRARGGHMSKSFSVSR